MGNPFTQFTVTDDWAAHIARGSGGGIDYAMPVGTPLPAPNDGTLTNIPNNGTGGNTAVITRPDGSKTVYMHLSRFTDPRAVRAGEIVGYSGGALGAPGSGNSTGPHLHTHDLDAKGNRVPPFGGSNEPAQLIGVSITNPWEVINAPVKWISDPQNWVRIGLFALGATILAFVFWSLFAKTDAGQAVIETVKGTATDAVASAKTAAKVAALA